MAQRALAIYQASLGEQHPNTLNSLLTVKGLQVMKLLQCDKQTLISILQANLLELNTESMLMLLDLIATNPEVLQSLREALQRQT